MANETPFAEHCYKSLCFKNYGQFFTNVFHIHVGKSPTTGHPPCSTREPFKAHSPGLSQRQLVDPAPSTSVPRFITCPFGRGRSLWAIVCTKTTTPLFKWELTGFLNWLNIYMVTCFVPAHLTTH